MDNLKVGDKIRFKSYEVLKEEFGVDMGEFLRIPNGSNEIMERLFKEDSEHTILEFVPSGSLGSFKIEGSHWTYHTSLIEEIPILNLEDIYG